MTDQRASDMTEIYHVHSTVEARRILDVILAPNGVEGVARERRATALPAPSSEPGAVFIAVRGEQAEAALQLLREARENGYLTEGGFAADFT